jgi:hypothetical protein
MAKRALFINGIADVKYNLSFLEFIIPRFDKDAAMQCIARKPYTSSSHSKSDFIK